MDRRLTPVVHFLRSIAKKGPLKTDKSLCPTALSRPILLYSPGVEAMTLPMFQVLAACLAICTRSVSFP